MKALKRILTNWIQVKRINVFVLFLLMALLISIVIKLANEATYTLRLELIPNHDNPREIIIKKQPQFIDITLKSDGFGVLKYAFSKRLLQTDLNTLEKSSEAYLWNAKNQRKDLVQFFGSDVDILAIAPTVIAFGYDEQSVKKLPVKIQSKTSFATGYDMFSPLRSTPDSVDVVGPKTVLDNTNEVLTTPVVLDNLNSNINQTVKLILPEPSNDLILTENEVVIKGDVEKFTEGVVRVPIRLIRAPEEQLVSIFPKEISVVFYTSLKGYNSIASEDFIVECDFSTLNDSNDLLIPKLLSYPSSVKRVSLQLNQIEYVIKPKK